MLLFTEVLQHFGTSFQLVSLHHLLLCAASCLAHRRLYLRQRVCPTGSRPVIFCIMQKTKETLKIIPAKDGQSVSRVWGGRKTRWWVGMKDNNEVIFSHFVCYVKNLTKWRFNMSIFSITAFLLWLLTLCLLLIPPTATWRCCLRVQITISFLTGRLLRIVKEKKITNIHNM